MSIVVLHAVDVLIGLVFVLACVRWLSRKFRRALSRKRANDRMRWEKRHWHNNWY